MIRQNQRHEQQSTKKLNKSIRDIVFLVVLILITFLMAGARAEVKQAFTTQELLADYDQMWDILHQSFPFLSLAGKSEAELEALRRENRELIGTRVTDVPGLYMLMQHTCRALGNIGHLQVTSPSLYRGLRDYVGMKSDPQSDASYTQLDTDSKQDYFIPPPSVNATYIEDAKALYLRFPTFSTTLNMDEPVPIAAYLSRFPDAEHIIFDVCANPGGYMDRWMYNIVSAFAEPVEWTLTGYLRLTDAVAEKYSRFELKPLDDTSLSLPEFAKTLGMTHQGKVTYNFPMDNYQGEQISKPIQRWLLVDEGVYSGADALTRFCIDTGWAKVVGRTTKGDGALLLGPSVFRVDHSGLLFSFLPEGSANKDGTLNTIRGTMPNYFSKPSERPLDTCIRIILNDQPKSN